MAHAHVAIIGTAGRDRAERLTPALFAGMTRAAAGIIKDTFGLDPAATTLISGGAAWADHVAVALYLEGGVAGLTLYTPCAFQDGSNGYADTGVIDWRANPGGTANYYHRRFSKCLGRNTLGELGAARERGATFDASHPGFHARNSEVARVATHMIALTWAEGATPADGGTLDTWKKCPLPADKKVHVSLGGLY